MLSEPYVEISNKGLTSLINALGKKSNLELFDKLFSIYD